MICTKLKPKLADSSRSTQRCSSDAQRGFQVGTQVHACNAADVDIACTSKCSRTQCGSAAAAGLIVQTADQSQNNSPRIKSQNYSPKRAFCDCFDMSHCSKKYWTLANDNKTMRTAVRCGCCTCYTEQDVLLSFKAFVQGMTASGADYGGAASLCNG